MPQSAIPPSRHAPVRPDWLDKRREEILEPDLPIVDPHHHHVGPAGQPLSVPGSARRCRQRPQHRRDLLRGMPRDVPRRRAAGAEIARRDRIRQRHRGDERIGQIRQARCIAGIIGNVDLRIGSRAKGILEQHVTISGGRFKGIRNGATWHADPSLQIYCSGAPEGLYRDRNFREGFAGLASLGLSFDAWVFHTQLGDVADLARAFPQATIVLNHVGGALAIGPYAGKREEGFAEWRDGIREVAGFPNTYVKLGGLGDEADRVHVLRERRSALLAGSGEGMAALYRDLHQGLRPAALDVREQFPGRQGHVQLSGDVERLQAHRRRLLRRREDGAVQRRRKEGVSARGVTEEPLTHPPLRAGSPLSRNAGEGL